ncbi:MAG: tetratricopeptide repeat protein [Chlamydiales bacterium]
MRVYQSLIHSLLLITTPALFAQPLHAAVTPSTINEQIVPPKALKLDALSYDEILTLLSEMESGELEERCSPEDLENVAMYISYLAVQGVLPNEVELSCALGSDIQDVLFQESSPYVYARSFDLGTDYVLVPALPGERNVILCKSWLHKKWDQVKKFAKKHKKEIIIGAAVVVAAATVVGIVTAVTAGGAAAAGAAATDGESSHRKSDKPSISPIQDPVLKSALEEKVVSFKEAIASDQFFHSSFGENSLEESGRIAGSLLGHDSLSQLADPFSTYPGLSLALQNAPEKNIPAIRDYALSFAHQEVDRNFSTDFAPLYAKTDSHPDFNILSHQLRGERALASNHLHQAVYDFGKTIELNPTNPIPYLERGIAHFGLGEYDRSIADYNKFLFQAKKTYPLSIPDFSLGFAKGLPKGIYESGRGILILLSDIVTHPVQTGGQIWEALTLLSDLARSGEWKTLSEVLAPEIHQLVIEWDTLPSTKRGELAGYAFGKYGADILIPGALAKATARGFKAAEELAAICRGLQTAEKTLLLESAAGLGNGAKVAEVVRAKQTTAFLAEEFGFSAKEMLQLKQAGKLEGAIDSACESWLAKSPSEAYIAAKNGGRHADLIPKFSEKPIKEIEKSIRSYEKLIVEHQDKIVNPSKYCPDWDNFHPNRQKALIEKIWPAEIQCYTEQKDVLTTILNQKQ